MAYQTKRIVSEYAMQGYIHGIAVMDDKTYAHYKAMFDESSIMLPYKTAPPTRILAHNLILSFWLGWMNNEKGMDRPPFNVWDRLQNAVSMAENFPKKMKFHNVLTPIYTAYKFTCF
jgi:hypothetical protein